MYINATLSYFIILYHTVCTVGRPGLKTFMAQVALCKNEYAYIKIESTCFGSLRHSLKLIEIDGLSPSCCQHHHHLWR